MKDALRDSQWGGEVLMGLCSRGARCGGVCIAGARRLTSKNHGDGDVCSFLEHWESCSQGEGLSDTASGGYTIPMVALGLSTPSNGQMGFWLALGTVGVAAEEGGLPALQKDECEGKSLWGFL